MAIGCFVKVSQCFATFTSEVTYRLHSLEHLTLYRMFELVKMDLHTIAVMKIKYHDIAMNFKL